MTTRMSKDELRRARQLLHGTSGPRPVRYWVDVIVPALIGWPALYVATTPSSWAPAGFVVAVFGLWRGVQMIHELVHLRRGAVPGIAVAWSMLFGLPFFIPLFSFGAHLDHHRATRFATADDPEYLPLTERSRWSVLGTLLESLLAPIALWVRFGPLVWVGLLSRGARRWVLVHASTLGLNRAYRRRDLVDGAGPPLWRLQEALTAVWAAALPVLVGFGVLELEAVLVAATVAATVAFVDQLKTLAVHRFEAHREAPVAFEAQVMDAVDVEGGWWSELWAPLGNRFHALHHLAPQLPYHEVGRAHRLLMEALPADAAYRTCSTPSLSEALLRLVRARSETQSEVSRTDILP